MQLKPETISGVNDTKIVTPAKLAAAFEDRDLGYSPENVDNKTNTVVGNETSTSLYPSVKGLVDWTATTYQSILTSINFGTFSAGLTAKTTPVDADTFNISNSADSNKAYKLSWQNVKATLKSYFDTIYATPTLIVKRF